MNDLLKYFKGYMKETLLGPFFKLLEASFELLVPLIIAQLVDVLIPQRQTANLPGLTVLLVFLALLGVVVAITAQFYSSKAAVGFARKLTQDLYEKILGLSQTSRDQLTTSSLVTRLTSDTYQIQMGINQFLRLFLRAPIIVFGSIIMAFTISPSLTLWFLLMVALLVLIIVVMSRIVNPLYASIRKLTDRIVNLTRQQLEGMRVIRAFGQTKAEVKEFRQTNEVYKMWQIRAGFYSSLISPLTYLVVNATLLLIIWQGQGEIQVGNLSQGMLVALVNYLLQILTELLKLALLVTNLNQSFISARRITQVLEESEEDIEEDLPSQVGLPGQALAIETLSFTYPQASSPALSRISLDLQEGQTLGIIGGTGSGKSTLVQLFSRLYQPTSGNFMIFSQGRSPRSLKEWRRLVSVVPQKAQLFRGTIRSNLLLGQDKALSDEEIWQALEIAQAADFVRQKAGGLDEPVESFGRNFSGGQRQRLTIARAVLRKSPFLILDDSTSALDYLTEARLLQAIKTELAATTLILISQRTKSLTQADKILVLDQGLQVGLGQHDDLLATNKLYQEIHYSQHGREETL